ncbi:histone-lysine N-methyltransferase SETMAR [Trichonephila clavipes]|nr:histone-lysine N-methyltransferase SETMAR [Trichonephila clavipes]
MYRNPVTSQYILDFKKCPIEARKITERLNLLNSTDCGRLKGQGVTSKFDIWLPHVLTERNSCRLADVCDLLLKRQENDPLLTYIITGDEKWVLCNNHDEVA